MKYHRIVGLGVAWFLAPTPATATSLAGAELHVDRTPSAYDCPDAAALAEASAAHGTVPTTPAEPLRLEVHFRRGADGYVALIEATGRKRGTRELESPATTCGALAETVSVVLAILTDLIPPSPDSPVLVPAPAPAPPQRPPAPHDPSFAVGPDFGVAYGLVGNVATATVALSARARYDAAELELSAWGSGADFEPIAPGYVSLRLYAGTAQGCWWIGREQRATLGGCAGIGVGSLHGAGRGYDHDGDSSALWAAALAGVAAELRIRPHWACRFALSVVVPFGSDMFAVAPGVQGISTPPLAISAHFGPEYRFW